MADKGLISAILQFLIDQLQDGYITDDFRKNIEVAIQSLESAYNVQAPDAPPSFNIYKIYRNTVDNATSNLGPEATAESKTESERLKNESNILRKQEKHVLAIEDCQTTFSIAPSCSTAYSWLGKTLMDQNEYHEALANYTKAIQLDDQNAAYYCNRAAIYVELGNHDLAIKDCHMALSIDPSHINAYDRLGNIFMIQKKHHEALDNYTKAIQLDGHNAAYYCNRAAVHVELGNHVLAIKDCHTALSINPSHSNTYHRLGNILMILKKHREALAIYKRAIQLDGCNVIAYCDRAAVHVELGNHAVAIKDCHTALSINPSCSKAYDQLGNILVKQKKHREALGKYTKAIQLDDHNAAYYCNRAALHIKLSNNALAIKDCRTALSIDPSNSEAYSWLGLAFCNLGKKLRKKGSSNGTR